MHYIKMMLKVPHLGQSCWKFIKKTWTIQNTCKKKMFCQHERSLIVRRKLNNKISHCHLTRIWWDIYRWICSQLISIKVLNMHENMRDHFQHELYPSLIYNTFYSYIFKYDCQNFKYSQCFSLSLGALGFFFFFHVYLYV